jgi:hypothetical protein
VNFVESLPYAVLKNLYPSSLEILLALAIAFFVYRYFVFRKMGYFSGALLLLFLLFSSLISDMYIRRTRSELVFFNISGVRALSVTRGTSSIVLYDRCENPSKKLGYCLNPYLGKRGIKKFDFFKLNDTLRISGDDFLVAANLIYFKGKKIYIQTNNGFNLSHREAETEFDLVWLDYSKTLPQNMSFAQIVLHNPSQTLDSKPKSIRLSQFVKMDKSFQIAYNRPIWGDSEGWYTGCFKPGK